MIDYRPFHPDDAEPCRKLVLSCIDDFTGLDPDAYGKLRKKIADSPYREALAGMFCIVATDGVLLVGMGALDGNTIKRMYVSRSHRGRRIGHAIYQKLEAEARRRNVARLELEASLNAVVFYERMGFVGQHETTWYMSGSAVKNLIMAKDL